MTIRTQCILCLFNYNSSSTLARLQGLHKVFFVDFDRSMKSSIFTLELEFADLCVIVFSGNILRANLSFILITTVIETLKAR